MKGMKVLGAGAIAGIGLALGLAGSAAGQEVKAGVVTSLQGSATVQRVSITDTTRQPNQPLPLKFKDDVFQKDVITTGDQSLARILLHGNAVVTVRERSSLTITETGSTATIDIRDGKVALAVLKDRMKPGERIDVKTPTAVAGVRGTVLITEVTPGSSPGSSTTNFTLLTGIVDVSLLDPAGRPGGSTFTLNALQTLLINGFTPPTGGPRNISRAQGQTAANSFKVDLKDAPKGTTSQISDKQVEQASAAAAAGTGTGGANAPGSQIIAQSVKTESQPQTNVRPENNPITTSSQMDVNTGGAPPPPACTGSCIFEGLRPRHNSPAAVRK